ncbi:MULTISPECIES: hypothetical protein [unclassified Isoptericola]|uniref:hypothetical protein n=1 Tax=unclassified Isoptericola TaxID=2623355 RepID=UPI002712B711|nr:MULTISPECIES: hypothetical protein [unclassified Isoptericola]MDO8147191.1 hypothetical protein [Isoptericola sp. b515]MDO8150496.1 hypothetical protein [Isoptericola sp. b408]
MDDGGHDAGHESAGQDTTPNPQHAGDVDPRMARFAGRVGEVEDPLTWGLDLEDEALTGCEDDTDPTSDRFVRSYRTFAGESLEVETLRTAVAEDAVEDVVRAAASGALAAPLHADIAAPVEPDAEPAPRPGRDFADDFADYRSAMRAIVAEVDAVELEHDTFDVDGHPVAATEVQVRDVVAVHVATPGRGLVITGPADLVDRVTVVTRPIRSLLHPPERR